MSIFKVRVARATRYMVEVEADTVVEARALAEIAAIPESAIIEVDVDVRMRLGEPWVLGWSGEDPTNSYHGRPDHYLETKDLLVFRRALGQVFNREEVALLSTRVEEAVGPVIRTWNGAGCSSLSIKTKTPFDKLTDAQVAHIMAPLKVA